ncbi:uncharacterized protein LOC123369129 [Mauremys mutica]|uniref:uncharacterized protein LOC123369129 n=1 Tax=Mauremys mutica TaxID=74926 RepID=UPI001D16F8A6|nr:uncharacterized protein LOC123369129 [Mauremys mutica]
MIDVGVPGYCFGVQSITQPSTFTGNTSASATSRRNLICCRPSATDEGSLLPELREYHFGNRARYDISGPRAGTVKTRPWPFWERTTRLASESAGATSRNSWWRNFICCRPSATDEALCSCFGNSRCGLCNCCLSAESESSTPQLSEYCGEKPSEESSTPQLSECDYEEPPEGLLPFDRNFYPCFSLVGASSAPQQYHFRRRGLRLQRDTDSSQAAALEDTVGGEVTGGQRQRQQLLCVSVDQQLWQVLEITSEKVQPLSTTPTAEGATALITSIL